LKRILFIDDENYILTAIERMLRQSQGRWEMRFVNSGEGALEALDANAFDVVIADMRMPDMDGITLLGLIRDRFPNTGRIILSGYSEAAQIRSISIAHRVVSKPCSRGELESAIESVLSRNSGDSYDHESR
jgi:DNA-binding NarL/FixJ family response regulator